MSNLLPRANDAIRVNGDHTVNGATSDIAITVRGSNWYWAVCALMFASTFAFIGLSFTKPRQHRIFHYITASITMVAAIAYFCMGADLGQTGIRPGFMRSNPKVSGELREIFYVRYIDWVITTPLLLLDLLLTAGMPWPTILYTLLIDEIMIVTGLVGALVTSSYKFGFFAFGCAALLWVAWTVTWTARRHANAIGADIYKVYLITGVWTIFLWFLYPIAWGLSEGGNVIAPDSEAVFYGILDLMAKPVFGAMLLWGHRNIDPARLGLHIRDYDEDPATYGAAVQHDEKRKGAGPLAGGTSDVTAPTNGQAATTTV